MHALGRWMLLCEALIPAMGHGQFLREASRDPGPECNLYDAEGWLTLYDGSKESAEKYWWIAAGSHGDGGNWWVAEDSALATAGKIKPGQKILWSDQNPGGNGGLLYTHRRYRDAEFKVSIFPGWQNDGGLFLRASGKGPAWQVMIDYVPGKTVGGIWPEGLDAPPQDFYRLDAEDKVTTLTLAKWNAADWPTIWDPDGFNTIFAKVTGSNAAGPKIKAWITDSNHVVTDYPATMQSELQDDGHIGLQIHVGPVSWQGGPNKYQWMKVRELDPATGAPLCKGSSAIRRGQELGLRMDWAQSGPDGLMVAGQAAGKFLLTVTDAHGRVVGNSAGGGGEVAHRFAPLAKGVYIVTLADKTGSRSFKAIRY